ncbi:PQQ-binding-like beta-propeller repeat protein, partial [Streptomyces acidicola]|uniref:outer membrane protein assembly factor BamB family protein n=1 Tax=Streptomyces acidicola TaxID=2596892 RepID=UPI0037BAB59A
SDSPYVVAYQVVHDEPDITGVPENLAPLVLRCFDSDSPYVVAYQVVHDEPDITGVPENLAPLVLRCLAKEPEDRPTPDELMRELRSAASLYDTQSFIPAQRADTAVASADGAVATGGNASKREGGPYAPNHPWESLSERAETAGPTEPAESAEPAEPADATAAPRRRRRALLAAGALVLTVGVALGSVQLLGGGAAGQKEGAPPDASASAGVKPWDIKPASEKPASAKGGSTAGGAEAGSTPQCSYGEGKLLCAQPGLVSALDPADGSVLWRHTPAKGEVTGPPVVSGGLVHVWAGGDQRLEALDPGSGRTRWEKDVSAYDSMRSVGGMVLLYSADGTVTGLDGATGERKWSHPIQGHSEAFFTSFDGDRLAYLATTAIDGSSTRVTAVDPVTGDVRWDARLKGFLQPVGSEDGRVYFLAVDSVYQDTNAVVRYDPETGKSLRVRLPVQSQQAAATVRGDTVFLVGLGGSLVAVDMGARKQQWSLETSVSRGSVPVADGERVYFMAPDGRLLAVDADTGKLLGQTSPRLGEHSDRVSAALPGPVVAGDLVCSGAPDGTVFAVDRGDPSGW